MNTFNLRDEILAQTQDPDELFELVKQAIMADCPDDPNAQAMTSCRMLQGMAGGIRDESGLMTHVRELEQVAAFGFGSLMFEKYAYPILNQVRRQHLSRLMSEMAVAETQFNLLTLGDEIEHRLMQGQYDDAILAELLPKLEHLKATM